MYKVIQKLDLTWRIFFFFFPPFITRFTVVKIKKK